MSNSKCVIRTTHEIPDIHHVRSAKRDAFTQVNIMTCINRKQRIFSALNFSIVLMCISNMTSFQFLETFLHFPSGFSSIVSEQVKNPPDEDSTLGTLASSHY